MNSTQYTPPADCADVRKGAIARERMLQAALAVFGQHGFDAATTRMLALEAGMNLGAIPYYFGSKEDLYGQAADYLATFIETRQQNRLLALLAEADKTNDRAELCDLVVGFMLGQAQIVLTENIPTSWMHFFLRAQAEHGPAFERLYTRVIEPAQAVLTRIVGRIVQRTPDDPVTRALSYLGIHQVLYIRLADSVLMRRMEWDQITPDRVQALLDTIGHALRAQLLHYPAPSSQT